MSIRTPGRIAAMAVKNIFHKPATISYAGGAMDIPRKYRGKLEYDPANCIDCHLCERDCPTGAIKMINDGTKQEKKMRALLDMEFCIFCCQCVDSCPKKCLSYTPNIDLATLQKKNLKVQL